MGNPKNKKNRAAAQPAPTAEPAPAGSAALPAAVAAPIAGTQQGGAMADEELERRVDPADPAGQAFTLQEFQEEYAEGAAAHWEAAGAAAAPPAAEPAAPAAHLPANPVPAGPATIPDRAPAAGLPLPPTAAAEAGSGKVTETPGAWLGVPDTWEQGRGATALLSAPAALAPAPVPESAMTSGAADHNFHGLPLPPPPPHGTAGLHVHDASSDPFILHPHVEPPTGIFEPPAQIDQYVSMPAMATRPPASLQETPVHRGRAARRMQQAEFGSPMLAPPPEFGSSMLVPPAMMPPPALAMMAPPSPDVYAPPPVGLAAGMGGSGFGGGMHGKSIGSLGNILSAGQISGSPAASPRAANRFESMNRLPQPDAMRTDSAVINVESDRLMTTVKEMRSELASADRRRLALEKKVDQNISKVSAVNTPRHRPLGLPAQESAPLLARTRAGVACWCCVLMLCWLALSGGTKAAAERVVGPGLRGPRGLGGRDRAAGPEPALRTARCFECGGGTGGRVRGAVG